MNNVKNNKSLRVFLALCLLVQLVLPNMVWGSLAAGGNITINFPDSIDATGKTFDAHLVMEMDGDGNATSTISTFDTYLKNLAGASTGTPGYIAGSIQNYLSDDTRTATELRTITDELEKLVSSSVGTSLSTSTTTTVSGSVTVDGYYLIVDTSTPKQFPAMLVPVEANDTINIKLKADEPTMTKQIQHNEFADTATDPDDALNTSYYGWGEVGDNQIGDTVEFLISATLPADVTGYSEYFYMISDDMDLDHWTFGSITDIYTTFNPATDSGDDFADTYYTDKAADVSISNGFAILVDVLALRAAEADPTFSGTVAEEIFIRFTATLKETANIATASNDNTAYLLYSNSVHDEWNGTAMPDEFDVPTNDTEMGSTDHCEDTVYDYTFVLDLTKQDNTGSTNLNDTVFALYEYIGSDVFADVHKDTTNWTQINLTGSSGEYYTDGTSGTGTATTATVGGVKGKIFIYGLDDTKIYRLEEVTPTIGYTIITEFVYFTLGATYSSPSPGTAPTPTLSTEVSDADGKTSTTDSVGLHGYGATTGGLQITIANNSGSMLPETGGVGTVMFYVAGIGMMAAAGFLIYKRKES